jgi:hypothetical protein
VVSNLIPYKHIISIPIISADDIIF